MALLSETGTFGLLPESRPPWKEFLLSMGTQGLALFLLLIVGLLHPQVLLPEPRDYHFIQLVNTPPPVKLEPAPLKVLAKPEVAKLQTPNPEALRLPAPLPKPKVDEPVAPKVDLAHKLPDLPPSTKPVIPRQLVKTDVFSTGSSATPTIAKAPDKVQTGGFGDPNGVPNRPTNGRPITIAQMGSFDLPSGPGSGNGTGGARGAKGVVASAGFGSGVATGDGSGRVSGSRGTVRQGGFGDADAPVAASTPRPKPADPNAGRLIPAEIMYKPNPVYTDEARRLRLEGEVLLEVVLGANGQLQIMRVVRGLGHGLDEAAVKAAGQIRFKPATRDGQATDSTAILHIIFQLA
jgi:TonB family protein